MNDIALCAYFIVLSQC